LNVLVSGGAGYIGSSVSAELLRAGHRVTIYDDLSHCKRQAIPAGSEFVVGDVADRDLLRRTFQASRPEAVLHFAAFIEAGESMAAPQRYFRNNTVATLTLLETMLEHGVKKLVFSSSTAVYGDPTRVPIEESDPLCPANANGESELLIERMLNWFQRIHHMRYASLRYFNAAGAVGGYGEDHEPESHLIPLVLRVALGQREAVSIYGTDYSTRDGTCVRDYIHVADLAAAHMLTLEALAKQETLIYNLGNGCGFSVREVIETARRVTGHPIPAVEAPRRPGDMATTNGDEEHGLRLARFRFQYHGAAWWTL